jgi:DNA-binding transcriptional regulator YhcF (GntR family)
MNNELEGEQSGDEADDDPAHRTVVDQATDIVSGVIQGRRRGERLPSEREIGDLHGISHDAVNRALHALANDGVVESRVGRHGGWFIAGGAAHRSAYDRVQDHLREQIPGLERGERLPSVRDIAHGLDVSRATAERAVRGFAEQTGLIQRGDNAPWGGWVKAGAPPTTERAEPGVNEEDHGRDDPPGAGGPRDGGIAPGPRDPRPRSPSGEAASPQEHDGGSGDPAAPRADSDPSSVQPARDQRQN